MPTRLMPISGSGSPKYTGSGLRVRYHPAALAELADAAVWYETRRVGLGQELRTTVRAALRIIAEKPRAWPRSPQETAVRVFSLRRFPFLLPYAIKDGTVIILALAHAKGSRKNHFLFSDADPSRLRALLFGCWAHPAPSSRLRSRASRPPKKGSYFCASPKRRPGYWRHRMEH